MIWIKRSVAIIALLAIIAWFAWAFVPKPVEVEVGQVTVGRFEQTVDEDGKTRVRERYVVSTPLAGTLMRVEIHAGDTVEAGGLLATLAPNIPALLDARTRREFEERVGQAEAGVLRAGAGVARVQAALDQAKADLARAEKLAREGFVAPANREQAQLTVRLRSKEFEAARFEQHAAQHEVEQARAALLRLHEAAHPGKAPGTVWEIRSPVRGRVLRVMQENEGAVVVGSPIMELAQLTDMEIVIDVLSTDAVQIPVNSEAYIDFGVGTKPLSARVRLIEPSAFTKISALGVEEQRVNVILDLTSPPEQWTRLGDAYRVDARIVMFRAEQSIQVPMGALFRSGNEWAVFVVNGERAEKRVIKVARRNGTAALVSEGLHAGDRVVLYPSDAVTSGVRLKARAV
jgi:HlyD family secretion protein